MLTCVSSCAFARPAEGNFESRGNAGRSRQSKSSRLWGRCIQTLMCRFLSQEERENRHGLVVPPGVFPLSVWATFTRKFQTYTPEYSGWRRVKVADIINFDHMSHERHARISRRQPGSQLGHARVRRRGRSGRTGSFNIPHSLKHHSTKLKSLPPTAHIRGGHDNGIN